MGEIGRDRHETLYQMRWWEILLITQGYRMRNALQYQLQRIQAHAAAFCMGNPNNKTPQDIVHLYIDDYLPDFDDDMPRMTPEAADAFQKEMQELNANGNPFGKREP